MNFRALIKRPIAAILVSAELAACQPSQGPSAPAPTSPPPSAAAVVPGAPVTACPATTFDGFLTKFTDDLAVQKRYVANPLESDTVDANAEPEPTTVKKMLTKGEVVFPVIPSSSMQGKDGLVLKQTPEESGGFAVELAKPDTDDQMTFHFRPADGCWQLYRTEDDSL
ncbi:hypothetical protein [Luteibacter aegosomatissinici]|uniref:hypothetical protein n=1 Tax=Luteibacter aegosomatissinici TaxID=2911539 RepID=UPI001FF87997|nr:hypothetical protein [Luteibacter aegosomatissinici]UPG95808.1 hypothetical protein L2Y97_06775 [Luteibacter aegosomatissinici]